MNHSLLLRLVGTGAVLASGAFSSVAAEAARGVDAVTPRGAEGQVEIAKREADGVVVRSGIGASGAVSGAPQKLDANREETGRRGEALLLILQILRGAK